MLFQSGTMASDLEELILIPAGSHSAVNRPSEYWILASGGQQNQILCKRRDEVHRSPNQTLAAIYSHLIAFTCSPCLFSTLASVYMCKSCGSLCPLLASSVSLLPACSKSFYLRTPVKTHKTRTRTSLTGRKEGGSTLFEQEET
ncbi:hypothetical protein ATANTOWER_000023, partial [Ataeniobius toweri]|nr:hypothetical protein [Ataeniobius toweri]